MAFPSTDPERVVALVALNFREMLPEAENFEVACLHYYNSLQEERIQTRKGQPTIDTGPEDHAYRELYEARKAFMTKFTDLLKKQP